MQKGFALILLATFLCACNGGTIEGDTNTSSSESSSSSEVEPTIDEETNTVTYGIYPQTVVDDETLLSSLNELTTPESNGWYLYNNEYYVKHAADPAQIGAYKFSNGNTIVKDTIYWYKCEPIVWDILSKNDNEYLLLSHVLLDEHNFYDSTEDRIIDGQTIHANNYEYSDMRSWLNNDFYNHAFIYGGSRIIETLVDNSASTTHNNTNPYACNNTSDKVFALSYKDYRNAAYGFSTSTGASNTRFALTTDWTRANKAVIMNTTGQYAYNGIYATRSPRSDKSYFSSGIYNDGSYSGGNVNGYGACVRPAITITAQ